jgi:hypothetical protein
MAEWNLMILQNQCKPYVKPIWRARLFLILFDTIAILRNAERHAASDVWGIAGREVPRARARCQKQYTRVENTGRARLARTKSAVNRRRLVRTLLFVTDYRHPR